MERSRLVRAHRLVKRAGALPTRLRLELLEDRTLLDAGVGLNHPEAILRPTFGAVGGPQPIVDQSSSSHGRTPTNVLVNNPNEDGSSGHDTQSETSLVLGTGNNIVVGYNDLFLYPSSHFTGYSVSNDGGQTFTDKGAPPASSSGDAGDPVLARDNVTGRIYFATLSLNNSSIIWVFHTDDNGNTFSTPVNGAPGLGFADKEWMAVDNNGGAGQGNVYLIVRDFASLNGIFLFRSTDHGATFGPSGGTLIASGSSFNVQGAWVTVGPDHTVYAFWYAGSSTPTIQMRKSTDMGVTFGAPVTVATLSSSLGVNGDLGVGGFRSNTFPQAVVNPISGNLYVTFDNRGAGAQRADVFFTQSTNGGATWSAPVSVTDDTTTRDKWQPAIAVTPDGNHVGIFWYDRRNDPSKNLIDRYGVTGSVSGNTVNFGANYRISDTSFPPAFGHDSYVNGIYMGDYDQAVASNSAFYLDWGDNRLVQAGRNNPDVRFATIQFQSGAPATHFLVFAPSNVIGGAPFSMTVEAVDDNGIIDQNYQGTVSFSSSDGGASLPGTYTFTAGDAGAHRFDNVALVTGGSQTVTVSDGTISGSATINVTVITATHLQIVAPASVNSGFPFSITVKAVDDSGTVDPTYRGTVSFNSSDGGAILPSSYAFTAADAGQHTFNTVILVTGGMQTIGASDGTLSGSATINVIVPHGFLPPVNYGVGTNPTSIAVGDFNGDGALDIATANETSNDVTILLGNGDGTFQPGTTIRDPLAIVPNAIAAGNLGNGFLDLVVANFGTQPSGTNGSISVFLGNGDGTFQAAVNYADAGGPSSVALYDLLGNGILDIVVSNNTTNTVTVFLGNGDGTFQAPHAYAAGTGPVEVAIADFNFDGILDLAVVNQRSSNVSILIGNGDGSFQPPVNYTVGSGAQSIAMADLNGDGIPDLVTANYSAGSVSVLIGNGNGTFRSAVNYAVGTNPAEVNLNDFNGDGAVDIAVVNYGNGGGTTVSLLLGIGDGTFEIQQTYATGRGPWYLTSADLNGDGTPDLVVADLADNAVSILLNAGNFPPTPVQRGLGVATASTPATSFDAPATPAESNETLPVVTDTTGMDRFYMTAVAADHELAPLVSRWQAVDSFDDSGSRLDALDGLLWA
jgi:hypothetical protein